MARKRRTYNTRLIRADYSYTTQEIADLFGVDVATVRRWIRIEGLERIPGVRPHLVHSSALRNFLERKKAVRRQPCAPNEAFCFTCRAPRVPEPDTGSAQTRMNGSVQFKARCSTCGGAVSRVISGTKWGQTHPLAAYIAAATIQHKGEQRSLFECSLHEGGA